MRADQARTISILDYLRLEGFNPALTRHNGREFWYRSPLRSNDDTPSFKVDALLNKWFDHGLGEGGNALDLVIKLRRCTVRDALNILEKSGLYRGAYAPARTHAARARSTKEEKNKPAFEKEKEADAFILTQEKTIAHPALIQYLARRKIDLAIAQRYLKEIHFKKTNGELRDYFALGWFNGASWEARNAFFKGVVGAGKSIRSVNLKSGGDAYVLEGFTDFFAFLSKEKINESEAGFIILNSLALRSQLEDIFNQYAFRAIHLFLDNDESRRRATAKIKALAPNCVIDRAHFYAGYKDYNEWAMR